MCKSICEAVWAVILLVFALFFWGWTYTKWVVVIVAIILLIHSFTCKKCFVGHMPAKEKSKK